MFTDLLYIWLDKCYQERPLTPPVSLSEIYENNPNLKMLFGHNKNINFFLRFFHFLFHFRSFLGHTYKDTTLFL